MRRLNGTIRRIRPPLRNPNVLRKRAGDKGQAAANKGTTDGAAADKPETDKAARDKAVTRLREAGLGLPLLCRDSSNAEDVDRLLNGTRIQLVNTDPPYNVNVEPASNGAGRLAV